MKNIVHLTDCIEFAKGLPDNDYDLAIGIFDAFERNKRGPKGVSELPFLIHAKNLKPFISDDLWSVSKPVEYTSGDRVLGEL
jgi:hypothetical protein